MRRYTPFLAAPLMAACAVSEEPLELVPGEAGLCDASAAQQYVGEKATQENGTLIQKASGAQRLRWGAPNSAWTMDYRLDRVNVRYDDNRVIVAITCG